MVYYELYGLPGAGKTTISSTLIMQLREKGYKVAGFRDIFKRNSSSVKKVKYGLTILFSVNEYILYYYYWKLYRMSRHKNRKYLKYLISYSHQLLKTAKDGKYDIIFLEEGIIQFLSALFFQEELLSNGIINRIANYWANIFNITPVNCLIDVYESMNRIKNRPYQQNCRYSHSSGTANLEKALMYRSRNLDIISSAFPSHIEINMKEPAEYNINILLSLICKSF